jgi:protein-disulfide isomerase
MSSSKREEVKLQRQRRQRQQRMNTLLIIGGIVLLLIVLFISPTIVNALRPVGDITEITPIARPLVDGRAMGDPLAPVVVEVFEDFQCPRCKDYSDTVEKSLIQSDYITSGQVYYIFRHYPFLDRDAAGQESHQAANASMCASEQGRFWDYHDILFVNWNGENQGAFTDKRLAAFAENLGLDMSKFNSCFKDNTYENEINSDYDLGLRYGVQGTPTVFVNGEGVTPGYVPSYDDVVQAIEAALSGGG